MVPVNGNRQLEKRSHQKPVILGTGSVDPLPLDSLHENGGDHNPQIMRKNWCASPFPKTRKHGGGCRQGFQPDTSCVFQVPNFESCVVVLLRKKCRTVTGCLHAINSSLNSHTEEVKKTGRATGMRMVCVWTPRAVCSCVDTTAWALIDFHNPTMFLDVTGQKCSQHVHVLHCCSLATFSDGPNWVPLETRQFSNKKNAKNDQCRNFRACLKPTHL